MPTSPAQWDEKHRVEAEGPIEEPSTILRELLPLLPRGPALDLACGTGRNALFLAHRRPVTAVDRSEAALDALAKRAAHVGIAATRGFGIEPARSGVHLVAADLENSRLPSAAFSVILCTRFLERSLFPKIAAALAANGMLMFETFTRAQLGFTGGPRDPRYLLEPGELRVAFPQLETVFYRELNAGQGIASLLARKAPGSIAGL
jgi:tellurite methyltransferase